MPQLTYQNKTFNCETDESVLECLLRHSVDIPHSCRKGTCHSCILKAESGDISETAQRGLKDTEKAQGLFLACSCQPSGDMTLSLPSASLPQFEAKVLDKQLAADDVLRLRLQRPADFDYYAGQFINLFKTDTVSRSYSLASIPSQDDFLEFHIKLVKDGAVSSWLHQDVKEGDTLRFSDAKGSSFYMPEGLEQDLLLIGTGTGLAPLYGIARQAIASGHQGNIVLYHGSRTLKGLYMDQELRSLADSHPGLNYIACVSGEDVPSDQYQKGRANEIALTEHKELKGWRVYLCGHPDMVEKTKLKSYLAGASLQDIHADPFIPAS